MATYFFLQVGGSCKTRADKAVALQDHTTSEAQTPTYVEILPSPLSVDEHKHSPARIRYSNNLCTLRRELQTDAAI